MSVYGYWLDAVIANGGTASAEVDLDPNSAFGLFDFLQIVIPTVTSGTIKLQVAEKSGGTFQDLGSGITTSTTTGGYSTTFKLGGWRYIKVVSSAAQGAERTFRVRGEKI